MVTTLKKNKNEDENYPDNILNVCAKVYLDINNIFLINHLILNLGLVI